MAVNVFWRELEAGYYDPRDPYGNKDHLPAARALQSVETVMDMIIGAVTSFEFLFRY